MELVYLVDGLTAFALLCYGVQQWWRCQQEQFGRVIDVLSLVVTLSFVGTYLLMVIVLPEGDKSMAWLAPVLSFPMVKWILRILRGGARLIPIFE